MVYKAAYIKTFFDNMVLPYKAADGLVIEAGKYYVVNTKFGEDIGLAVSDIKEVTKEKFLVKKASADHGNDADIDDIEIDDASILDKKDEHIPLDMDTQQIENLQILKEPTAEELKQWHNFRPEEKKAYESARKEITDLQLVMKLINVHYLYQRKKIIFNFTADNRIDFRQLVKRLAALFKTRIEMRQIGVRDAAKICGGHGVCGIINCCLRSNCHMNSIYLKMAKDQGFVVNSSKLTGSCGRLMCCLSYEMDFYSEERKKFPEVGSLVNDGSKDYHIVSVNILKKDIYIAGENHHQKKFPLEAFQFVKKDNSGLAYYRLANEFVNPNPNPNANSPATPRQQQNNNPHQQQNNNNNNNQQQHYQQHQHNNHNQHYNTNRHTDQTRK